MSKPFLQRCDHPVGTHAITLSTLIPRSVVCSETLIYVGDDDFVVYVCIAKSMHGYIHIILSNINK
jgi:hypothetical protein